MPIDINTLAPWVAIAVTLILSILVPLFTQIANNRFQLKMAKQDRKLNAEKEKLAKETEAYEQFLVDVGAAIQYRSGENLQNVGASISRLYLYVPTEQYGKLEELYRSIHLRQFEKAEKQFFDLAELVAKEYHKTEQLTQKEK